MAELIFSSFCIHPVTVVFRLVSHNPRIATLNVHSHRVSSLGPRQWHPSGGHFWHVSLCSTPGKPSVLVTNMSYNS